MLPEGVEHELVVHEQANGTREFAPDRVIDPPLAVEDHDFVEIVDESGSLARRDCLEFAFVGVDTILSASNSSSADLSC